MISHQIINEMVEDAKLIWPEKWPVIEKHFQRCCLSASVDSIMWNLGFFSKKGMSESFESMLEQGAIPEQAQYVFKKLLDILVEEEIVKFENNQYTCLDPDPEIPAPAECLVEAMKDIPEERAAFQWLSRGMGGINRLFKGKLSGEEVMFGPWSDFTLVSEVYYSSKVYAFWSKLAGKVAAKLINHCFDRKVSLLEVGAGTGNGTTELLSSLDNPHQKIEKYVFTDVHRRLVKRTAKNFTEYSGFMEFKALNATEPLDEQDVELESADILYAVNVMHAINDITAACQTMYQLVKKGGYVVLGEIAPPRGRLYRYMELTFGLLNSYNQYDDKDLRPLSPLLRPEQWIEYFKKAGFEEAMAIPGDKMEGDRGGAIIAKK